MTGKHELALMLPSPPPLLSLPPELFVHSGFHGILFCTCCLHPSFLPSPFASLFYICPDTVEDICVYTYK